MEDILRVALVQNTLDAEIAWNPYAPHFPMQFGKGVKCQAFAV